MTENEVELIGWFAACESCPYIEHETRAAARHYVNAGVAKRLSARTEEILSEELEIRRLRRAELDSTKVLDSFRSTFNSFSMRMVTKLMKKHIEFANRTREQELTSAELHTEAAERSLDSCCGGPARFEKNGKRILRCVSLDIRDEFYREKSV